MILWDINSYSKLKIEIIYNDVLSALVKTDLNKIPTEIIRDALFEFLSKPYLLQADDSCYNYSEFYSYLNMIHFDDEIASFEELLHKDLFITTMTQAIQDSIQKHINFGNLKILSQQLKALDNNVACLIRNYSPVVCAFIAKELNLEIVIIPESTIHSSVQHFIQEQSYDELIIMVGDDLTEKELYSKHTFNQDKAPIPESLKINNLYIIEKKE